MAAAATVAAAKMNAISKSLFLFMVLTNRCESTTDSFYLAGEWFRVSDSCEASRKEH